MEEIAEDKKSNQWGETKAQPVKWAREDRHVSIDSAKARTGAKARSTDRHLLIATGRQKPRNYANSDGHPTNWAKLAECSKGAQKAAMPKGVKPMLATLVEKSVEVGEWLMR